MKRRLGFEEITRGVAMLVVMGEAYFNQPQDVLDAIQVMRSRAQNAGSLQSTPEQHVTTQGSTIIVEPVLPDTCYLPVYDPWIVYGPPVGVYPGYIYDPWYGPPYIAFWSRYWRGILWTVRLGMVGVGF